MKSNSIFANHGMVFAVLAVLALSSVLVPHLQLSPAFSNGLIFSIAFLMAGLVLMQYMGLKWEGPLVYGLFFIPVILFAILVVALIPDVSHQPIPFFMER